MSTYYHGVRVLEDETTLAVPVSGTAGLQVVIGTAPINLAKDPKATVNTPILCNSFSDCVEKLGYSDDFSAYTLCQSMYTSFKAFAISPVIFINVLDPATHTKDNAEKQYTVTNMQVHLEEDGILLDTLVVKAAARENRVDEGSAESALVNGTDYVASFDTNGKAIITLLAGGSAKAANAIKVASKSIDPTKVKSTDIIGGYNDQDGTEKGIEAVRKVYPKTGMTMGLLLAPGWSQIPEVGVAMALKNENLNGVFYSESLIDLDTKTVKKYTDCKEAKKNGGYTDKHQIVLWPMVKMGERKVALSAVYGAMAAYTDASNDNVPNLSPSNRLLNVTGAVLEDGTEVYLDQPQANVLNGQGIVTVLNDGGWRAWGNNTACFPDVIDPKDRWISCRRFFSWWANSFILTYKNRVDNPANKRLIEAICDSENIRGNSYVSQGKCAGAKIEFREDDNPITGILEGKIVFRQHLAPFTPAEDIVDILAFDPDMLQSALS